MMSRQGLCPDREIESYVDYEDLSINLERVIKSHHIADVFFKFEGPHPVGFVSVSDEDSEIPNVRIWDKDRGLEENQKRIREYRAALADLGYMVTPCGMDMLEIRCR